jgi:hypothetical protein
MAIFRQLATALADRDGERGEPFLNLSVHGSAWRWVGRWNDHFDCRHIHLIRDQYYLFSNEKLGQSFPINFRVQKGC